MIAGSRASILTVLLALAVSGTANAQAGRRSDRMPGQSLSATVYAYDFASDESARFARFELDQVAPGLTWSGPGYLMMFVRGSDRSVLDGADAELEFTDFSLRLRNDVLRRSVGKGWNVSVPILLVSTYRRVRSQQDGVSREVFEHTAAGVGSGAGLSRVGRRVRLDARAAPAIGFATRSFGNSIGRFLAFEVDVEAVVARVFGRVGLTAGYGWGIQQWHVGGLDALTASGTGKIDYTGTAHAFRLGAAW